MAQQLINIGTTPNDGTGTPIRSAFDVINQNFTEIYGSGPVLSNINIANNTISSTDTNGNINLNPDGTGKVVISDDSVSIASSNTPAASIGQAGDTAGMIAWDANYIYVCTADYDGVASIWKRSAIAVW